MKKAGIAAIVAAGIVVLGGGAWAAVTLPASDEQHVTSEPVEPTPTPEVETTPEVTPTPDVTPAPTYTEEEAIFLDWAHPLLAAEDVQMSDDEALAYLYDACDAMSDGAEFPYVVPPEIDDEHGSVNVIFLGGARNGYYDENDEQQSFCS